MYSGTSIKSLNPNIKMQFLLPCPYKFIIAVAGRSCKNFKISRDFIFLMILMTSLMA